MALPEIYAGFGRAMSISAREGAGNAGTMNGPDPELLRDRNRFQARRRSNTLPGESLPAARIGNAKTAVAIAVPVCLSAAARHAPGAPATRGQLTAGAPPAANPELERDRPPFAYRHRANCLPGETLAAARRRWALENRWRAIAETEARGA